MSPCGANYFGQTQIVEFRPSALVHSSPLPEILNFVIHIYSIGIVDYDGAFKIIRDVHINAYQIFEKMIGVTKLVNVRTLSIVRMYSSTSSCTIETRDCTRPKDVE